MDLEEEAKALEGSLSEDSINSSLPGATMSIPLSIYLYHSSRRRDVKDSFQA